MPDRQKIYVGNDNEVEVIGLKDVRTGAYANSASLTATLKDETTLVNITGAINLALSYVASSNGNYVGTMPASASLVDGVKYVLWYDGTGGGVTYHAEKPCVGAVRRE